MIGESSLLQIPISRSALVILVLAWNCSPAYAYIGPGLGAGIVATVLGVVGAIFLMLAGVVYFPIKRAFKRIKEKNESKESASGRSETDEES